MRPNPGVAEVIDARAVRTVFQPLVRLADSAVLGYEALSRGPAGTDWESPAALFAAARRAGRDAELDWVCRAAAYRAALAAGLPDNVTLFVNMEPAAWRTPCPPDLVGGMAAGGRLRVVTEMTERAIADDPAGLLLAAANCRAAGQGVALDDVGADPASLALMPFAHPDVVKLDMHLLRRPRERYVAHVVNAVLAYAESTGATILAEGIETPEHLEVARTMGATMGQGWLFGRPGPLPATVAAVRKPVPLIAAPDTAPPGRRAATPVELVAAARPLRRTTKSLLMPISRYLEAKAGDADEPPVLLACFQDARFFTAATARRFTGLAGSAAFVAALGVDLPGEPAPGVRGARLAAGEPLAREWNVIVVGPHFAAALVAREVGGTGPDAERRFDHTVTYDRPLVLAAARSLLHWLTPAPSVGPLLTG